MTDLRSLLVRYIAHVGEEEGSTFIYALTTEYFTEAEINLLEELELEAEAVTRERIKG